MVNFFPFQRTGRLIRDIDEYLDKVSEAILIFETTLVAYAAEGADERVNERLKQIRAIETQADDLRRDIVTVMYTEMLMPDTRGDLLGLLEEVDKLLDDCVHIVAALSIERPELPADTQREFAGIVVEATKAAQALMDGARAYFKEPHAVRNHTHKIGFHEKEATSIGLRLGRRVFDSDLPLERKRQLMQWLVQIREIASRASDAGDRTVIFAVKRSL